MIRRHPGMDEPGTGMARPRLGMAELFPRMDGPGMGMGELFPGMDGSFPGMDESFPLIVMPFWLNFGPFQEPKTGLTIRLRGI